MTAGSKGDDAPGDGGRGSGAQPQASGGRVVVRGDDTAPGESQAMSAADTAMAAATAIDTSPEVRKTPGRATPGVARMTPGTTSPPGATPGPGGGPPPMDSDGEDPVIGTTLLGRYLVTNKIGQGGMGAVYEATHTLIGKRVAVKVLLDKYARKEQVVARLEQEARLASSIGHEHIIDITDFGTTDDGRTFVVMEFLEGESLAECLHREGPLPETRILQIAQQVASALSAAHAKGIVHRDVKPENVFLLRRKDVDYVKVVDFGISKSLRNSDLGEEDSPRLTQTGMVLGTPLYMSPEQARGDDELDQRIDVYALGVIMYELATGRVPYSGTNYLSIISQVLNDEPVPPREIPARPVGRVRGDRAARDGQGPRAPLPVDRGPGRRRAGGARGPDPVDPAGPDPAAAAAGAAQRAAHFGLGGGRVGGDRGGRGHGVDDDGQRGDEAAPRAGRGRDRCGGHDAAGGDG